MTELCELAIKHKTDKVGVFMHNFTPTYYELFNAKRNNLTKLLEIGIGWTGHGGISQEIKDYQGGASLRMWEEYFPNAEIYGCDNQEGALFNQGRIKTFLCDEGNLRSLKELKEKIGNGFDIIINDGSHNPEFYILSTRELLPLLNKDGIFIIEDVNNSYISMVEREFRDNYNVEIRRFNPNDNLVDDNIAIIRNK